MSLCVEECGHNKCVELLIKTGADVNKWCGDRPPPLLFAAKYKRHECVRTLIRAGADVNCATWDGQTPFMLEVFNNNVDAVKPLINVWADVNRATDEDLITPLAPAGSRGFLSV